MLTIERSTGFSCLHLCSSFVWYRFELVRARFTCVYRVVHMFEEGFSIRSLYCDGTLNFLSTNCVPRPDRPPCRSLNRLKGRDWNWTPILTQGRYQEIIHLSKRAFDHLCTLTPPIRIFTKGLMLQPREPHW